MKNLLSLLALVFIAFNASSQSDNCVTATVLDLSSGTACANGSNSGATSSNTLYGLCNGISVNEVWYTYVSNGSQNDFQIDPGTMQDAEIVVYTGGCAGTLELCDNSAGGANLNNSWGIPAGTQVWVGVMSSTLTDGSFELCIDSYTPPPGGGNACGGAIPVCEGTTVVDMNPLTSSAVFPNCFLGAVNQDVWFTFDVLSSGTFEWSAVPTGISTAVELDWALFDITGGCPGVEIDCNYNFDGGANAPNGQTPGGTGEFNPPSNLIAGNTYAIVVDFFSSGLIGTVDFSVDGGSAQIAPDADFTINPAGPTCANSVNITITDNSVGAPDWDFGNGNVFSGNNPPIQTYNTPGTYAITASFGGACPSVHTEFVELFGPLNPVGATIDETCPGDCDGSASVATTGGSGIYNYVWTPGGATTPDISALCAGNYSVTVTDATCGAAPPVNLVVGSNVCACLITNFTANVGACIILDGSYQTTGVVEFNNPPTTGQLIVEDCNGNQDVFNAPFIGPLNYTITGQTADGGACDVTAYFTDDLACTQNIPYVAPICPCNIDFFEAQIGLCDQLTDTYSMSGYVDFSGPPATGTMIIEVDNGTSVFDTIINPPFVSGQTYSISGIPSDGSASTITVYFSDNAPCTSIIGYNAPASCACDVDIGTFTTNITGDSPNNGVLCYGDVIDITSNGDWTGPTEATNPPGPVYSPGVSWLMYSCPPTIALVPDPNDDVPDDPCFIGLIMDTDMNDLNDLGWINSFPPGTFTDNIIYWVPITMYSQAGGTYSYVNGTIPCYELGPSYPVQYLPEFSFTEVEDCITGEATVTVNGGLPELDGSDFVASNLLPATASFANTNATHAGDIVVTGLAGGDMWSFTVDDGNGCPYTISGGPFPPLEDPGFSYTGGTWCTNDGLQNVTLTGVGGGTYTAVPVGLSLNAATGQITTATSTPGTYDVTYTTPGVCFDALTVSVTIKEVPTVDPIADETVCVGTDFTAINFTGSMGTTSYDWVNDNNAIGLALVGNGDIAAFTSLTGGGTEVANITVTPSESGCVGATESFILTVNDLDDPSFDYAPGLTYCQTAANPTTNLTGMAGGTFTYATVSGGPTLDINPATGDITLLTSDLGVYDITYNTAGAPGSLCPQTFTLQFVITGAPVADFTLDVYCANNADPLPTYINGGSGGLFSAAPGGLVINANTGEVDLDASTPGLYTVTNDINVPGCPLATYDDDITIFEIPDATISGTASICPLDPLPDLTIDFTAGAANWDITYNVDGVPTTINTGADPYIIAGAAFGTYDLVTVTDANGCTNAIAGQAIVSALPVPVLSALADQAECEDLDLLIQNFGVNPAGSILDWTATTDVGFGLAGVGQIGNFTTINGTGVPIQSTVDVTPTSVDGCLGLTESFIVTVNPLPIVSFTGGPLSGCEPLEVSFTNTTANSLNCQWQFGNGNFLNDCGPVSNVYMAGDYDVTLTVMSNEGCTATATYASYVNVSPQPVAAFSYSPQEITVEDPVVEFTNSSLNADIYNWDFGDNSVNSAVENPIHLFPSEPNNYTVTLWAYNAAGTCYDSVQQVIQIKDVLIFYVPNIMTPDGDEFNEDFFPVFTSGYDKYDYHMTIFNRWGEIVFESYDASVGWNGHYGDGGLVQDGVYVWQIDFKESMSDKRHIKRGHVTVLK
jgi:gliding motility-associated-like protein